MSIRCKELGVNLSREAFDFCPTASATGEITRFCPTASATGGVEGPVEIDFEPLRAQMREALRS